MACVISHKMSCHYLFSLKTSTLEEIFLGHLAPAATLAASFASAGNSSSRALCHFLSICNISTDVRFVGLNTNFLPSAETKP